MTDEVTDSNEKDGKTWLRRTLSKLLKREKRGDVIAAYVGEGARDVVIGKNIIKIGTLVIPTVPVLAILFVVVSALIFVAVNFLGPTKMDARFNVAVAEVGEMDAEGRMHRSEDGQLISKWMFDELVAANEKYEDSAVEIWHDSLSLLEKRVKLGMVSSKTPEDRAKAASELASKVDADVVIYGHLTPPESPAEFVLEFYVKPRVRGEANVTIGRYQLGEPIPIPENFDRTDTLAKEALGTRVANRAGALFWLLLGLREDLLGRSEEALAVFRQAEAELTHWKEQGEGKETLYFFIGRSALFLGRYEEAEEALERALQINPTYARAQIVLAGVDFRRVVSFLQSHDEEHPLQTEDMEQAINDVERAIDKYQKGLELAQESHEPLIEIIARLALASAYRLEGQGYFWLQDGVKANRFFELAIEEINPVLEPLADAKQHRILAQAYLYLGAAYTQQAEILRKQEDVAGSRALYEKARAAYAGCIGQGEKAPEDEFLQLDVIADAEQGCQHWDKVVEEILLTLEGGQK
jgi:tetratricopeptide (TPR) repeat protein